MNAHSIMSTISNCTRTSADSSWGLDRIRKEIYIEDIDFRVENPNEEIKNDTNSVQDSCYGHITSSISNITNNSRNTD
jgi:hypothetical protein